MAIPFENLSFLLRDIDKKMLDSATYITANVAEESARRAVGATPVYSGLHRSNWIMTINSPSTKVIPPYRPRVAAGIAERSNRQAAQAQHRAALRHFRNANTQKIYLTNNAPLIESLNAGRISVQGSGMVEKAVLKARTTARRFAHRFLQARRNR